MHHVNNNPRKNYVQSKSRKEGKPLLELERKKTPTYCAKKKGKNEYHDAIELMKHLNHVAGDHIQVSLAFKCTSARVPGELAFSL
jgi:hypothetical protein